MSAILSVDHVGVRFGGLVAIADLHLDVAQGEILSLIGPNGAGKTTAFNVMTGFLKPSQGDVRFRGTSLTGLSPHAIARLGLARTFQRTSVFPDDTVFDNVMIGLHGQGAQMARAPLLAALIGRAGAGERQLRARAEALLDWVGLGARAQEKAGALAYGEQRLVGVALALATEPAMLLLDEPVSGMNASETRVFVRLIRQIRERGITILLVEHDMPMVMEVSDRIVVLNYGRLIAEGPPEAIRSDPAVIEAYLGQGSAARRAAAEAQATREAAHA
ncbi:ABC transporter ATP-binding protein [Methylobacterium isbiliense]|jgi:branched-chain amino acid transport system ATP-binding protein|uniref:Lipopolysaccharide export system ATP-binding protein LptB n=1 Tax=Methylobacterium isbiliense TaxID=315478 RepID=A0ABQ4SHT2_9HYPH|nr:ABC transporter ATP-binding protein [Methylobacterium isbiliense]MDN3623876.1 ABC transporter ATP-binding protein [Methylobacterium isbiliense]GJE02729.1 Lipopolysaccharide export system ATP-binding protein LptB [Methylobacterium isbiliense]